MAYRTSITEIDILPQYEYIVIYQIAAEKKEIYS